MSITDLDHPLTLAGDKVGSLSVRASVLIAADPATKQVIDLVERVATSDAAILVVGETGTGKELIAQHLHTCSNRSAGPFAGVNCGAFPESLVESELFGHEAGAFTGSQGQRAGWFETAHRGTLFLDEIGDLPLAAQVKLLRVLQEREVVRVGGRKPIRVDVRLVAATNVDLEAAVAAGRFRADLFYRIKVVTVRLPPLRQRRGDILPLADHFLGIYAKRLGVKREFNDDAELALLAYPWPGNIRELENVVHRATLVAAGKEITPQDLALPVLPAAATPTLVAGSTHAPSVSVASLDDQFSEVLDRLLDEDRPELLDWITDHAVRRAYSHGGGSQVQAAKLLGISRNVFRTLMKRAGLLTGEGRVGRVVEEAHQQLLTR